MFSFLTKTKNDVVASIVQPTPTKTQDELIDEIHESFFTEVDRLLIEANIKPSSDHINKASIDKAQRLASLGFNNAAPTKKGESEKRSLEQIESDRIEKEILIEAIQYFSMKYPNYKFITTESIYKICNKYGLIFGPVSAYIGDVPDFNLKQMESFKLDPVDEIVLEQRENDFKTKYQIEKEKEDFENAFRSENPQIRQYAIMRSMLHTPLMWRSKYPSEVTFNIAAPKKDFDLTNMELDGFELKVKPPENDPIVTKAVLFKGRRFHLIATAWGKEASDPDVVNEKMN